MKANGSMSSIWVCGNIIWVWVSSIANCSISCSPYTMLVTSSGKCLMFPSSHHAWGHNCNKDYTIITSCMDLSGFSLMNPALLHIAWPPLFFFLFFLEPQWPQSSCVLCNYKGSILWVVPSSATSMQYALSFLSYGCSRTGEWNRDGDCWRRNVQSVLQEFCVFTSWSLQWIVSSSDIISIVLLQSMQSLCNAVYLFNNFFCPQLPCLPTWSVLTTLSLPNHRFLKLSVLLFAHCKSD